MPSAALAWIGMSHPSQPSIPLLRLQLCMRILDRISPEFVKFIGKKYESLFTLLGDDNPDFLSGLRDLTDRECARLKGL